MKNKKYFVKEIWTELDYKEGFSERTIIFPAIDIEKYKALPWVKEYQFFELNKENENISTKIYITPPIKNPNYNPTYFFDDQHKMIKEKQITLNLVHYVKEIKTELDYITKRVIETKKLSPIKNKEKYKPSKHVKQYNFIDYLEININEETKIYEIPNTESEIFINEENKPKVKILNLYRNPTSIKRITSK